VFLEPQFHHYDDHDTNPEDSACLAESPEPSKDFSTPRNTVTSLESSNPVDQYLVQRLEPGQNLDEFAQAPDSSHDPRVDRYHDSSDDVATTKESNQPSYGPMILPSVQRSRSRLERPAPLQGTSKVFPDVFSELFVGRATRGRIERDPLVPGLEFPLCFGFTSPSPLSFQLSLLVRGRRIRIA